MAFAATEVELFAGPTHAPELAHDFGLVTVTVQVAVCAHVLVGPEVGARSRCSRFPPRVAEAMPQSRATIVKRIVDTIVGLLVFVLLHVSAVE